MRTALSRPTAAGAAALRPDRKAAILLAAEKLFAQHGYHAVSLRQIAADAGVPLALVSYYYGAKHELFHAIFEHWSPTIGQRLALLDIALSQSERPDLREIVRAFIEPVVALRASAEGEYYAMLVARELVYRTPDTERVLKEYFDPMANAFIDALQVALPHATRAQLAWGYQFAVGALLHHLADTRVERLSAGQSCASDPVAWPLLVDFIAGGLHAALPMPDRAARTAASPAQESRRPTR
ncbi:TetR/AcrR family transcriptional regulator [Ottowia oryzae]|uniref:TetR family transcriptional regulator n=1 Tax=Ottowia oryzae TaxID=2109914 RepID=A0A2S0MC92_9BURK|nr:TetR/AcrR family transcriptional regulator [Ottowia oryzae]AVO33514.1 TetR family transcriptional regulator [Ottowia oryzae]